ncbi:MAG: tRNA dihydrouridine synthase DusB [Oscillospiraceae bacterium]
MNIGQLEIKGFAALAPMAGVADRAFRELCVGYGAAFVVSEMVSSKGITMNDRKSKELMFISENERPAAVQIFGSDAITMAKSVETVLKMQPQFIDINMGCPAPKIAGNGGGACLMKSPELVGKIIKEVVSASSVPVTAKIRAGWDFDCLNAVEIAKIAENSGASAITVHGRTRSQMYAPPVNFDIISDVKHNVGIPVIGNGDIVDGQTAALMFERTNCDFLMVGRGALGRPWVFSQINAYMNEGRILPEPPVSERMLVMIKHIKKICEYKSERVGIKEARKHAAWYIKGIRGAANYRQQIGQLSSIEELEEIAFKISFENQ